MRAFCLRSMVVMTLVLLAVCAFQTRAEEKKGETTLFDLARTPNEPGFTEPVVGSPAAAVKHHLKYHAAADKKSSYTDKTGKTVDYVVRHLLVISWFLDRGITALRYTVTTDGRSEDVRHVYNNAYQDHHTKSLTEKHLTTLKELVTTLPQSKAVPPIGRTVHVSFQDGKQWRTETYDATALPEKLEQILVILGERFETKDRLAKQKLPPSTP